MADGVNILDAAEATVEIATDDAGADGQVQIVKLAYSEDGVATPITGDADGLEVKLSNSVVHVDDNGGALTVDGTVTAELSATDNAVLDAIALGYAAEGDALGDGVLMQGDDGTDRTNVLVDTDGHLQVDAVSCASHPVTNAGTFAVQAAPAERAVTMKHARVALAASQTGATVLDPTNGTKCVLHKLVVSCATAGVVDFFYDTDTGDDVIGPLLSLAANGGWTETWDLAAPRRSASADDVLKATTTTFVGSVYIEYWEE